MDSSSSSVHVGKTAFPYSRATEHGASIHALPHKAHIHLEVPCFALEVPVLAHNGWRQALIFLKFPFEFAF